jgi:hypothetical protein
MNRTDRLALPLLLRPDMKRTCTIAVTSAAVLACLLGLPGVTFAQTGYYPPGPSPSPPAAALETVRREGLYFGFGLGGGSFNVGACEACDKFNGPAVDFHVGGMLTPRWGLVLDLSGVADRLPGDRMLVHSLSTLGLQYWPASRLWLKAGLGLGRLAEVDDQGKKTTNRESGGAFMLAAGLELIQSRSFVLDVQLRGAAVDYDRNETVSTGALMLGINFY